jgi:deoxycytidine triphosphate deaminase
MVKSDRWISTKSCEHDKIKPFSEKQVRDSVISYGQCQIPFFESDEICETSYADRKDEDTRPRRESSCRSCRGRLLFVMYAY